MPDCPCLPKCPFFNDQMAGMPVAAENIKKRLCKGDNSECARFMVFSKLGKEKVPPDLFPRHVDKAQKLIATG